MHSCNKSFMDVVSASMPCQRDSQRIALVLQLIGLALRLHDPASSLLPVLVGLAISFRYRLSVRSARSASILFGEGTGPRLRFLGFDRVNSSGSGSMVDYAEVLLDLWRGYEYWKEPREIWYGPGTLTSHRKQPNWPTCCLQQGARDRVELVGIAE